jgi:hypothetical protein
MRPLFFLDRFFDFFSRLVLVLSTRKYIAATQRPGQRRRPLHEFFESFK